MTQKLHENEQPSWIFTNARTRSIRASARTQPMAPTSPATKAAVSSLGFATTVTFGGRLAKAFSCRFAAQPVTYTCECVRAARAAALRLFATASFVTQHVLITATSAPAESCASTWPSRSSASRTSCTSACETLQPKKSTRNVATREILRRSIAAVEIRRPAVEHATVHVPKAGELRLLRGEIAGGHEGARVDPRRQRFDGLERDVRDRCVGGREPLVYTDEPGFDRGADAVRA